MCQVLCRISLIFLVLTAAPGAESPHVGPAWDFTHGPLRVDATGRGIAHADGTPFLWLADTAWELFHRLDRDEVELYLDKRRAQGFTVIQTVALAEFDGLNTPNAYGHRPLVANDPARLRVTPGADPTNREAYDYWDHVDYVFAVAAAKGLIIALLPTWGDKVPALPPGTNWGSGPQVFTVANARAYGRAVATRYATWPNLIWINGGDRTGDLNPPVWNALAEGIREVDAGRHLMTFHPIGGHSSRQWFATTPWHDLTMLQTGHRQDTDVWTRIAAEWAAIPVRPVVNGEPTYEAHPFNLEPANGYATAHDTRKYTYWCLFSGAFGHTYGCHPVWQFYGPGREPALRTRPGRFWKAVGDQPGAIDLPGAWSILATRRLLLSRPMAGRIPAPWVLRQADGRPGDHQVATLGGERSWAMAYAPSGLPLTVDVGQVAGDEVRSWWFDPRRGTAVEIARHRRPESGEHWQTFTPPAMGAVTPGDPGNDWILVLDAMANDYAAPGLPPR